MNPSNRLISSIVILGLGPSGLAACDGEVIAEDGFEPVAEAQADETWAEERAPSKHGEDGRVEPVPRPEAEPDVPDVPDVIVGEAPMVNVLRLTCLEPDDADGMDEPMIVINGKQAWLGAGFVPGKTEAIRYEAVAFDEVATIELWEVDVWDDYTDPNDRLGFLEVQASAMGDGPQIGSVEARGVKYELVYQVERCPGCSPGEQPPHEP